MRQELQGRRLKVDRFSFSPNRFFWPRFRTQFFSGGVSCWPLWVFCWPLWVFLAPFRRGFLFGPFGFFWPLFNFFRPLQVSFWPLSEKGDAPTVSIRPFQVSFCAWRERGFSPKWVGLSRPPGPPSRSPIPTPTRKDLRGPTSTPAGFFFRLLGFWRAQGSLSRRPIFKPYQIF